MKKLIIFAFTIATASLYSSESDSESYYFKNDCDATVKIGDVEIEPKQSCIIKLSMQSATRVRSGTHPMYDSWTYKGSMLPINASKEILLISSVFKAPRDVPVEGYKGAIFKQYGK